MRVSDRNRFLGLALLSASCAGDVDPLTPIVITATDPATDTDICQPVVIEPASVVVQEEQVVTFTATGGSGNPVFTLIGDGAGTLDADGTYEAPAQPAMDQISLMDAGCPGSALADIEVVPRLLVSPEVATVPPGTEVPIDVQGGSGATRCTLASDGSGASLVGCVYTAGSSEGIDIVEVVDDQTGIVRSSTITVRDDGGLQALGDRWAFPRDASFTPAIMGGSGSYALTVQGSAARVDPGAPGILVGAEVGLATVQVVDVAVPSLTAAFEVEVLEPLAPPATLDGRLEGAGRVVSVDLDGDGYEEAIVGSPASSVDGPAGGVVAVHPGLAGGGVDPSPSWTVAGDQLQERVGSGLALGDLDADGVADLIVGAPGAVVNGVSVGEVRAYRGLAGGVFESTPAWRFAGGSASDGLGSVVGVCDVDGDGALDVVASSLTDDPTAGAAPNTGALSVYVGSSTGPVGPPEIRYGAGLVGGVFTPLPTLDVGLEGLAVGDVDGDGACDIAVGSARDPDGTTGVGMVLVYAGRTDGSVVSAQPVRVIAGDLGAAESNGQLGRALDLADVDGDGAAELVVGARSLDGSHTNGGRALVFRGGPFPSDPTAPQRVSDAAWSLEGDGTNQLLGSAVDFVDTGAGVDLVVAASRFGSSGAAWRFAGSTLLGAAPITADTSTAVAFVDDEPDDAHFGVQVAGVPSGGVLALQGRHTALPSRVDTERFVFHDGETVATVAVPGRPSMQGFGEAVVRLDVDGQAGDELLIGGPDAADPDLGGLAGRVQVRDGSASWTPLAGGTPTRAASDRFGAFLQRADFDGDGLEDLVSVTRLASRPATLDTFASTCAAGATFRSGAVSITLNTTAGLPTEPDFVLYGEAANGGVIDIESGFDHDGDGRDDVLVAFGSSQRRVVLVHGRDDAGAVTPIELCGDEVFTGSSLEGFGEAVATVGDPDGDGCDAVAIGSRLADPVQNNEGLVSIVWGAGPSCASSSLEVTGLRSGSPSAQGGSRLAGGLDLTGDGVPDLAVGSPVRSSSGNQTGAAWVVDGAVLAGLPRSPLVGSALPMAADGTFSGGNASQVVYGPVSGARFADAVELVATASGDVVLAVGAPAMRRPGAVETGAVLVYEWASGGLDGRPLVWVGGESSRTDNALGERLFRGDQGELLIGVPGSSADGTLYNGAVYALPL